MRAGAEVNFLPLCRSFLRPKTILYSQIDNARASGSGGISDIIAFYKTSKFYGIKIYIFCKNKKRSFLCVMHEASIIFEHIHNFILCFGSGPDKFGSDLM